MYKFGKLEKVGNRDNKYKLRCECGNVVYRSPQSLSRSVAKGYIPSCGCSKRQSSPEFVGLKGAAKKNKVVFTLTEKQFNTIKLRDCYYCGARNTKVAYLHPDKGYIYENSIAICVDCHTARGGMDHDEFLNWLKRVLSFSKTRNFGLERVVPVTI
jgi:5-methylcytosine-specific restriction endonuclease McrA